METYPGAHEDFTSGDIELHEEIEAPMTHIPTAVCATCHRELRPIKNGVTVESFVQGNNAAGLREGYYKVQADRYGCEVCGCEVYVGFGAKPIARHFDPHYARTLSEDYFIFREDHFEDPVRYEAIIAALRVRIDHIHHLADPLANDVDI